MSRLIELFILISLLAMARLAYLLCFTDHVLGGMIPAAFIVALPLATFLLGRLHVMFQQDADEEFAQRIESSLKSNFRSESITG